MRNRLHHTLTLLLVLALQTQVFAQFTIPDIKVEYVIDGDTFVTTVNNQKERIRMKCIDAPEIKQTFIGFDGTKQEIGAEAMEYLGRILSKSDVIKLKCSDGRDKYGRLTCDVFDDKNDSINLQMVKDGYAYAMPSQCFSRVDGVRYLGYQHLARFSQIGLWRYGVWDESWRWRNI
jgi:micrococcal nuclease